jgi:hypothetical protein
MRKRLAQAFRQAPWRNKIQSLGLFFLILIGVVVVAALYLSVSAQTAAAGLELQQFEDEKDTLNHQIADYETFSAYLNSTKIMEQRAEKMGFERITADRAFYVVVPGYTGRKPALLAPLPGTFIHNQPMIKPSYTQSIWDWLFAGVLNTGARR